MNNPFQLIGTDELDHWDYVLRRLFVLKSTPLKKAIANLAPGAQSLLKVLTDPNLPIEQRVKIETKVRDLTIKDWTLIVRAFKNWPFKPDVGSFPITSQATYGLTVVTGLDIHRRRGHCWHPPQPLKRTYMH